jgi:hypothetical protein
MTTATLAKWVRDPRSGQVHLHSEEVTIMGVLHNLDRTFAQGEMASRRRVRPVVGRARGNPSGRTKLTGWMGASSWGRMDSSGRRRRPCSARCPTSKERICRRVRHRRGSSLVQRLADCRPKPIRRAGIRRCGAQFPIPQDSGENRTQHRPRSGSVPRQSWRAVS